MTFNLQDFKTNTSYDIHNSLILIVDDVEFNQLLLKQILIKNNFHNVIYAKDGKEAIEKTKSAKPKVVVLDLMMPIMDGFEYCWRIRKEPGFETMPIIVQTASNVQKEKSLAFNMGATDFICKPIDPEEFIARLCVHLERQLLIDSLNDYHDRTASELESAKIMQQLLMPNKAALAEISEQYKVNNVSYFQPSSELGGDFWGTKKIDDDKLACFIVDFSGHGIGSAINTFRLHSMMYDDNTLADKPGEFLTSINNNLVQLLPIGQFATMFYGVIDIKSNMLYYASAAAPSPLVINKDGTNGRYLDSSGMPLGVVKNASYPTRKTDFHYNNILMLYSDALTETEDVDGEMLSEDRLLEITKNALNEEQTIDKVYNDIMEIFNYEYVTRLRDDFTLNVYGRF
jgi:phosphoserine phosphatase RsbU/P